MDPKEGRILKIWCLWIVVLEKTPESPLVSKEIRPVNLKGDQPWIFTGRTDSEAEAPVFWSSDVNRRFIEKVPDIGKDQWQKEKGVSEDEMAGWHHWCNEHELQQILEDGVGQAWHATDHGVTKSWIWLGDWTTMMTRDSFRLWLLCQLGPSMIARSAWSRTLVHPPGLIARMKKMKQNKKLCHWKL